MASSSFGERLKAAFKNARNNDIANKLGVSAPAVQHYVAGRVPPAETLQKISEVTNCNLHWLITGHGQPFLDENLEIEDNSSSPTVNRKEITLPAVKKRDVPWDEIYVMFSGLERFPENPEDLDELKMELEVVYHEIQKRLKQAELLKRRHEPSNTKSSDRD